MNRADLQILTLERIEDTRALLAGGRWSFAYYTAGYAAECALKSCVLARMIETGWIFQEKAKIEECRTHDFDRLIRLAGMNQILADALAKSAVAGDSFRSRWEAVMRWEVDVRYASRTEAEATTLFLSLTEPHDGVLPWMMKFW